MMMLHGFLMLMFFLAGLDTTPLNETVETSVIIENIPSPEVPPTTPNPTPGVGQEKGEFVRVKRVVDGDTIELETGEKLRYIGIDTPETVDPRKPVQCFGAEASKKNKELVEGKEVRLETDVTDKDKYGRLLRYVYIGDEMINIKMVKEGYAYSYSYPPDVKYQDKILKAQQEAESAKSGLWNSCPPKGSTTTSQLDSTTSLQAVTNTSEAIPSPAPVTDGTCSIKGNINTEGEKIFHVQGCGSYSATKIDISRGEKMFCSESEALNAGWRKALNCS